MDRGLDRGAICREVEDRGFAVARQVADDSLVRRLVMSCPEVPSAGVRDLLRIVPAFRDLATLESVHGLATAVLCAPAFVTRAILFDKSPAANWALGFHQDVVIAVAERIDTPGFGPWSVKAGIDHVRPPASVLEKMITIRVHLDACGPDNAPLAVIPGTHDAGFLDDDAIPERVRTGPTVECCAEPGDAVLMRPLLLHGSRKAEQPSHRRVAHFEFACDPLPPPLAWRLG